MLLLAAPLVLLGCEPERDVPAEPAAKAAEGWAAEPSTAQAAEPSTADPSAAQAAGPSTVELEPGPTITDRSLPETRRRIERAARDLGADLQTGAAAADEPLFDPEQEEMRLETRVRENLAALEDELTRPYAERQLFLRDALSALYDLTLAVERLDEMLAHAGEDLEPDLERAIDELASRILAAEQRVESAARASEAGWPQRSAEARRAVLEARRAYPQALENMSIR